jgi:hypothetical protein
MDSMDSVTFYILYEDFILKPYAAVTYCSTNSKKICGHLISTRVSTMALLYIPMYLQGREVPNPALQKLIDQEN